LYALGRGVTATTVSATPALGNDAITIQGTVTDQSPGMTALGIPAAGTPAISDDSMTQWMEYLYMQYPKPTNATGVQVTLSYVDPNNNFYIMGTTTSDSSGHYSYKFTPDIPGLYTVTATFAGSKSYYTSSAVASFTYTPTPTPAPTAAPPSDFVSWSSFELGIALVIIVVIVVGAVLALLTIRKRP
jgi:hypothetical protein